MYFSPTLPSVRALICEDDPAIASLLTILLQRMHFESIVARDGEQAVEALKLLPFDLVILDLLMPVRNGEGVLDVMSREHPHLLARTVIATASAMRTLPHYGVGAVVAKPFDVEEFQATLQRVLNEG